jgi:hypothetical protein
MGGYNMRPLEPTAKYHETTMQRIERERHKRAIEAYLDCRGAKHAEDSQDRFNFIIGAILIPLLIVGMMLAVPRAIDNWYHNQYEKPAQEYKQMEMKAKADAKAKELGLK